VFAELPKIPALDTTDTETEAILDRRMMKKGNNPVIQVLIKWANLSKDVATWEDWETITRKFPAILTLGQVSASPGVLSHTTRLRPRCASQRASDTCDVLCVHE
jgi:hypothetical protein